ncbi:unnamed protein product, partial [marine sediment metagenome]
MGSHSPEVDIARRRMTLVSQTISLRVRSVS